MPSTDFEGLRPGAGENEVDLFVEKRRDELDGVMDELRERLDVKTKSKRALESFRRDYAKSPQTFQATGIGILVAGAAMIVIALVKRGNNG